MSSLFFNEHWISSCFVVLFITILLIYFSRDLNIKNRKSIIIEMFYDVISFFGKITLGNNYLQHISFIGALISYILVSNILSFFPIPYFNFSSNKILIKNISNPTDSINSTLSLSVFAMIYIIYCSIKSKGLKNYLKSFIEPTPILLPLNIIGEIAKPFSLAMRLFGNMLSGSIIISLFYKYMPLFLPIIAHLYFDLFSGLIQSIIFTFLTLVYISFSI
jgi:F-type H+-transporting ATPase subunit a